MFQRCKKATACANFLQGAAGIPLFQLAPSKFFKSGKMKIKIPKLGGFLKILVFVFSSAISILINVSIQVHCLIPG